MPRKPDLARMMVRWCTANLVVPPGHKNAGQPMRLPPFMARFLRDAFQPHVHEAAIFTSRKNGKTSCVAAILLAHLLGPGRVPGFRGAVVSISREKAGELMTALESTANASGFVVTEAASKRNATSRGTIGDNELVVSRTPMPGTYRTSDGELSVLSADRNAGHSGSYDLICFDEIGLTAERDRPLLASLETSLSAKDGRIVHLSIPGTSPFTEEIIHRAGKRRSTVAHVYRGAPAADLMDRKNWRRANPGLGTIKSAAYMKREAEKALLTPSTELSFRAFDLAEAVDFDEELIVALSDWRKCEVDAADLPPRDGYAYLGYDAGQTESFTALAAYWPRSGRMECYLGSASEPSLAKRGDADHVGSLYTQAARVGEINLFGRRVCDNPAFLRAAMLKLSGVSIASIGADRYRKRESAQAFEDGGYTGAVTWRGAGAGQSADGSADVRAFQSAVLEGRLKTPKALMPISAIRNAVLRHDQSGNPALNRSNSKRRMDILSAMVIAVGLAAVNKARWSKTASLAGYTSLSNQASR